jgi:hypothetical protein
MSKRPTSSYFIAVASLLLGALAASQSIFYSPQDLYGTLLWIGFALGFIWLGYVIPSAHIQNGELLIVNPFRTARIGLGAIESVDTRFALKVSGTFGSISAWAAPAPGRLRHRSHPTEDYKVLGLKSGELVRPGDLPSTISGSLALQIQRAREQEQASSRVEIKANVLGIALAVVPSLLLVIHYAT